jgi:hypothetical protein
MQIGANADRTIQFAFAFPWAEWLVGSGDISGGDAVVFAGENVACDPLGMRGLYGGEHHGIGPEQMQQ